MKRNGVAGNSIDRSGAVSDLIGVILMVSLVVVGLGIISVFIVSQDTPVEVPSLSMIPGTNNGTDDLFLYHSGGDSLKSGEFFVRVDGEDYYPGTICLFDQGGVKGCDWDSWDLGESLIIEGKSDYSQIQIISTIGGQASLIAGSGQAEVTAAPTGTGTPTTTATPTATATVTPTSTPGILPVAVFTGSPLSGVSPLSVTFSDSSTGAPTSWLWNFGDGGSSTLQNPVHNYASVGTYNVSLRVTNAYGFDYENKSSYVTVGAVPVANFTGSPRFGVSPLSVIFSDISTGAPTSWLWNFGDGGSSTLQNPVHNYASVGTYNVSLRATNAYGFDDEIKVNYIATSIPLVANFHATDTTVKKNRNVFFIDDSTGGAVSWYWTFGDGGTSTLENPVYSYSSVGTYTVSLTVTNSIGLEDSIIRSDYMVIRN